MLFANRGRAFSEAGLLKSREILDSRRRGLVTTYNNTLLTSLRPRPSASSSRPSATALAVEVHPAVHEYHWRLGLALAAAATAATSTAYVAVGGRPKNDDKRPQEQQLSPVVGLPHEDAASLLASLREAVGEENVETEDSV